MNSYAVGKLPLRRWAALASLLLMALFIMSSTPVQAAPAGFVTTCGTSFCLNGQVFNVAGTNNHYLGWGTQYEVDQVLNDTKMMNLNVVRTIMHSVRGSLDSTQVNQGTVPLKWNWGSTAESSNLGMKGVYILYWDTATNKMAWNDSTVDGLGRWDYVIWKAKQLNLKLNIALLDFWQWAGGAQQINANFKGGNYDMSNAPDRYTFFFSDARAKQFYKEWVNHVLNRTNTLTGIKYKDDPTIFAWDLMNEPEISGTTLGQAWISEMSAYVKSVDPNHLVASGNEGFTDGHAGSNPQLEMGISTIDFATWHTYPTYHGLTPSGVSSLINTHCQTAANGRKPVLLQEFAYPSSNADQSSVYQTWLDVMYNNPNCAGWLFWRLEGRQEGGQYPADNGEHFGVFNNNSATALTFKNGAAKMIARGNGPVPTAVPTTVPTSTPRPTTVPTNTPTLVPTQLPPMAGTFYKGINFNGSAVTIEGKNWVSYSTALAQGLTVSGASTDTKSLTPNPATDAATTQMLNTLLYSNSDPGTIDLGQTIPAGTYNIYLWTMENWQSNSRRWNLFLENTQVASGLGYLPLNSWQRYGPYPVTVSDGTLNLRLTSTQGRPMIMGLALYSTGAPVNTPIPPTVTPVPPQPTALPTNTSIPGAQETFYKGVNFNGTAITVNGKNWLSYSTARGQGLTVSGASTDTKSLTPNPTTDSATAHMLNTLLYSNSDPGTIDLGQSIPAGTYNIYLWTMENWQSNSRRWNVLLEGAQVATGLGYLPLNSWQRYGPYTVTVSDGTLNLRLTSTQGRAMIMGLEIYTYK